MSDYYTNIYQKRLNRYGLDYQSRVQGNRERNFEQYLLKSTCRVDFEYDGKNYPASLERSSQDFSETRGFLLTQTSVNIPNGTVITVTLQDNTEQIWMIWWLESIAASGYNKYIILKMTHLLEWQDEEGTYQQWAYLSGPGNSAIQDTVKTSTGRAVYAEDDKLHLFIMGQHDKIKRDTYFEVSYKDIVQAFIVTDFDVHSTPGVEYVSIDPVAVRDKTEAPAPTEDDRPEDLFWLKGGK